MEQKSKEIFIERKIYKEILTWLEEKETLAITGPRQSGKTTLLRKLAKELKEEKTVLINFEDSQQLESFVRSPQTFVEIHQEENKKRYFLFDEFQYVKNGGKILKLLFDQFPQLKFIITGSSSLRIREVASFLVGRIVFFHLYPLSFSEYLSYKNRTFFHLWQKFNPVFLEFLRGERIQPPALLFEDQLKACLEEYLIFGGYPAIVLSSLDKKQERLASLVETYIEKDIIKYLQIGNFLEFKNFVKILASQTGNLTRYSSLAQDTSLSFREVKKFLGVLEQTFVAKLVPPYHQNKISELKKSPKSYFIDLGLRNSLISDFRELSLRPDKGAMVENFVFQNLFYQKATDDLCFWRTKQGAEVDFILKFKNEIVPIEVKYQSFDRPRIPRGLTSFIKAYSPKKAVILTKDYSGFTERLKTKILLLPAYFV